MESFTRGQLAVFATLLALSAACRATPTPLTVECFIALAGIFPSRD